MGRLRHLGRLAARRIQQLDLRFADAASEAAFKGSIEVELIRFTLLGGTASFIFAAFHGALHILHPSATADGVVADTVDSAGMPDALLLWQGLLWVVVPVAFCALLALRLWCGRLRRWSWEPIVVGMLMYAAVVIVMGQTYYLTLLRGQNPEVVWGERVACGVEAWTLLGLNLVTSIASLLLPVRTALLWAVPAAGLAAYLAAKLALDHGAAAADRELYLKVAATVGLFYLAWRGAYRNEQHLRARWRALEDVERSSRNMAEQYQVHAREIDKKDAELAATRELARSLNTVAEILSDSIIVQLDAELRMCETEAMHRVFFERDVQGVAFSDFLEPTDEVRFARCVVQSAESPMPACLPVTLRRRSANSRVHLLLLDRGPERDGQLQARYLLGIRVDENEPACSRSSSRSSAQFLLGAAAAALLPSATARTDAPFGELPGVPQLSDTHSEDAEWLPPSAPERERSSLTELQNLLPEALDFRRGSSRALDRHLSLSEQLPSIKEHSEPEAPPLPPLVAPLRPTGLRSRVLTFKMILPRWHKDVQPEACCPFHAAVESGNDVIAYLLTQHCDPRWVPLPVQCPACACMNNDVPRCIVCSSDLPRGAAADGRAATDVE